MKTKSPLLLVATIVLSSGCATSDSIGTRSLAVASGEPRLGGVERDRRGIRYVDFVPTPTEIKVQLEKEGWKEVTVIQAFPEYLQGPIRALGVFNWRENRFSIGAPQEYGKITTDRIQYLDEEFGTSGIVTAPLDLPNGKRAITFHCAIKQHYVMIIWSPNENDGYVWRSFVFDPKGQSTEMRFLMQRFDRDRI